MANRDYGDRGERGRGGERDWDMQDRYGPGRSYGRGYFGGEPYYGRADWESGYYGGRYPEPYYRGYGGRYGGGREGTYGGYGGYGGAYAGGYTGYTGEGRRRTFAGRGPKGWRRSDERIREDVNEAVARDPEIDATELEVRVENGVVTLTGIVEDRREKRIAEDLAEDVFGVDDVRNELKIRHGFLAGLTGEEADEREVERTAEREGAGTSGTRTTGTRTTGTRAGGRATGARAT